MKRLLGILLTLIFLQSCNSELKGMDKPDNLIPKNQMITLMTDMLILEGHITKTYSTVNRYYKVMTASGRDYLKSKHVTEKQYEDSFRYYSCSHKEYIAMLDKVMENLQKKSIELQKKP